MHIHVPVLGLPFLGPRQVQPNSTSGASSSRAVTTVSQRIATSTFVTSSIPRSTSPSSTRFLPSASFKSTTSARRTSVVSLVPTTPQETSDVEASTIILTVVPTYTVTEDPLSQTWDYNTPSAPASTVIEVSGPTPSESTSSDEDIPTSTFTLDVTPSFLKPTPVVLPTLAPCSGVTVSPESWVAEGVDEALKSVQHLWSEGGSFIDYIANLTGQPTLLCGIGKIGSCPPVDCSAFFAAGGQKWVYLTSASILSFNTFINQIHDGVNSGKGDLALVLPKMTKEFFEFKPKPTKEPIWPWIGAALGAALAFIPALLPAAIPLAASAGVAGSAAAFVSGGLSTIQPGSPNPYAFFLGTMQDLGGTLVNLTSETTKALDKWTQTLLQGKPDPSGKTILDYFASGRFAMKYNLNATQMEEHYYRTIVAKVIDGQWNTVNSSTRNFVMCGTEDVPCSDRSRFTQGDKTCCFYSLKKNGKYTTPLALDALEKPEFGIKASDIVAGSLNTYLNGDYNQTAEERIQDTFSANRTTQAFDQGVTFPGTFTLPVCNVGSYSDWVGDKDSASLPCFCGSSSETNTFIKAAHLANFGNYCDKCAKQISGFVCPKTSGALRGFTMDSSTFWGIGLVWGLWLLGG